MIVLVCAGAEYKAVRNGLKLTSFSPEVITLPMGFKPVQRLLKQRKLTQNKAVLIGLGGSLSSKYQVGDAVVYQNCSYFDSQNNLKTNFFNSQFVNNLARKLNLPLVKGLTNNILVNSSDLKSSLNQKTGCEVVDMESFAVMSYFSELVVIRIISDNYNDELPDLNTAINSQGKLDNFKMAIAFTKQPLSAIKLINNSLISLKKLEQITSQVMNFYQNS